MVIYATFLTRALDQILFEAKGLPIVFLATRAGIVNNDGETHQGVYAYPVFAAVQWLRLCFPSGRSEYETLLWEMRNDARPTMMVLPKQAYECAETLAPVGACGFIQKEENSSVIITALGALACKLALQVKEFLLFYNITADVLNARYPQKVGEIPFENKPVYVIEESFAAQDFSSYLQGFTPIKRVFCLKKGIDHASLEEILFDQGLSVGNIVQSIRADYEA